MRLINREKIAECARKHSDSETALKEWVNIIVTNDFSSLADLRATFNSVDYVKKNRYIFNIKGNRYRLVAEIIFTLKAVAIRFVGTHAEYDKIDCRTI